MRTACILLIVSVIALTSGESFDTFVPEDVPEDVDGSTHPNVIFAQEMVTTKAPGACKTLAEDLKKQVCDDIAAEQKMLDSFSTATGSESMLVQESQNKCGSEGDDLVKNAESQLSARSKELVAATNAKSAARNANVHFQALTFSSLQPGACSTQFFGQSSYITATKTVTTTTSHEAKKQGEAAQAKITLTEAKKEQERLKAKCRCGMRKAALEAFERYSRQDAARKEAYGRGAMLLCVLGKKNLNDKSCTADDMCRLKMPSGVHEDKCVAYKTKGVTEKCPTMCGEAKITLKGSVMCVGLRGTEVTITKCENVKLVKPAVEAKTCPATNPCGAWEVTRRDTKKDCPKPPNPCQTQAARRLHGSVACVCSAGVCSDKHCRTTKPTIPFVDCPRFGKGSDECKEQERKAEVAQKAVAEKAAKTKEIAKKKAEKAEAEKKEKTDLKEKADKSEKKDKKLREVADKKEKATKAAEAAAKKKEKDTKERNTKAEQATKAAEKKKKAAEAASERKTKAAEMAQKKAEAVVAAQVAERKAVETANELKSKACGTRTWRTNRWYAWQDCCQGCDGRSPSPGGLRGSCIARQKYNWGKDASECTCRATPKGTRDFKTNTYYAGTDCCQGCSAAQSQCIKRSPGFAWTSVCTCRMSC